MITPPPGWTVERTADGLVLCPPEGPERALFRYAEHRSPIRRAIDLVHATPVPIGFVERSASAPHRLTTFEGEHAALITRSGTIGASMVELIHGYVFLDDSYAALDGIATADPAWLVDAAEHLVRGDVHLLGRQRRRRFVYTPPAGWQGTGGRFEARWYPLDHPRNPARILVNPALPSALGLVHEIVDRLVAGAMTIVRPADELATRHGLAGEHHHLRGHGLDTHLWLLSDEHYLYSVRADASIGATIDAARALVDSIEPVPGTRAPAVDSFQFWAE